jgi:hypothetical protein
MPFHESYGEVSRAQLAAYRKFNVSPSDHDDLVERFGEDNHAAIVQGVKDNLFQGQFSVFSLWNS